MFQRFYGESAMESDHTPIQTAASHIEYIPTDTPANFVMVRVPDEGSIGEVRPGDLAVVDQEINGDEGETVVFRYEERSVFCQCVVREGEWFVRNAAGELRNASDMIREGAVYRGAVRYVVRPGKDRE